MKDYSLAEKLALVGLDSLDSVHGSVAKKAVLKGIMAARILDEILNEMSDEGITGDEPVRRINEIKTLSKRQLQAIEKETFKLLSEDGSMMEVQDILGCDIDFVTAGMTLRQYRSLPELYMKITEEIRAEILDAGEPSSDCVLMLWLLRECGIIHDLFSSIEQELVNTRLTEVCSQNPLYYRIFSLDFHSGIADLSLKYLKLKSRIFTNPYLEGINLFFPFLERRKSIFIDMIICHTSATDRRKNTAAFLRERGHLVEEVKNDEEVLLKVDNSYYRIFPTTRVYQLPVQGIVLVPFYK